MTVQTGQVYRDTDPRLAGRTLKVVRVEDDQAILEVVSNADDIQRLLDDSTPGTRSYTPKDRRGKTTKVAVRRLESGKNYALLPDAPTTVGPV